MKCSIFNYRGIASADLDLSKICLIAGPNEAGKTSISQALAAALTGDPVPITGVKKTDAGMLVRSGNANGTVELTGEAGCTKIQWPSAKVKTEGTAPFASHFATGLQTIVTMDDKTRVKTLTEYLKAVPTRADLDAQLKGMNLPPAVIDQLWQLIETQGWDNAAVQIKDKGARLKGQWEQITADRYGSKKADSWIPEGYSDELMGQSEDKLKALVTDARDALEAAIAADAVDDSKRAEQEALAALIPERQAAVDEAKKLTVDPALQAQVVEANGFIKDMSDKRDALNADLQKLPALTADIKGMSCPDCGTVLIVAGDVLVKPKTKNSAAEITKRKEERDALTVKIAGVNEAIMKHQTAVSGIQSKIRECERANDQALTDALRLLGEASIAAEEVAKPATAAVEVSVDECRRNLAAAELRLRAFTQKHEADRLHVSIGHNAELLEKISPEGIRGDVLVRALKQFNDSLAPVTKAAGWRTVTLESDFMPCYGGTIYLLLSESAKFRVRTVLAMGMSALDGSQALIIDAADILDKDGRNGLFRAINTTRLPALVAMTIDTKDLVKPLGKFGTSYWLNGDAVAEPVL